MFARETGGRLWVDQTGGGTQTVAVGPQSGGWCAYLAMVNDDGDDPAGWSVEGVGAWFYDGDPESDGEEVPGADDVEFGFTDDDGCCSADGFARFAVAVWPLIVAHAETVASVAGGE
jgi:hypothetical protein